MIEVNTHIINSTEQLDNDILLQYSQPHQSFDLETRTLSVLLQYQKHIGRIYKVRAKNRKTTGEKREVKRQRNKTSEAFDLDGSAPWVKTWTTFKAEDD